MMICLRETYAPVLLKRKTERLRKETGNDQLRSTYDTGLSEREFLKRAIVRPLKMLFKSPIVFLMSLYMAVVFVNHWTLILGILLTVIIGTDTSTSFSPP